MPEVLRRRSVSPIPDGPTWSIPRWVAAVGWIIAGAILGALVAWALWGRVLNHWNSPWRMAVGYAPEALVEKMTEGDGALGLLAVLGTLSDQLEAGRRWFIVLTVAGAAAGLLAWRVRARRAA
jgi:hypothetical protein